MITPPEIQLPPELDGLTRRQQRLAIALANGLSLAAAGRFAGLAGGPGGSPDRFRRSAWQSARSSRVKAAVAALRRLQPQPSPQEAAFGPDFD